MLGGSLSWSTEHRMLEGNGLSMLGIYDGGGLGFTDLRVTEPQAYIIEIKVGSKAV